MRNDSRIDVLVVGGGPVGLAAAIAIATTGRRVRVLDAARPPIDRACGEGILPAGVRALAALGVGAGLDGRPFRGIRFMDGSNSVEADFSGEPGLAVRRIQLHMALVDRAAACGVDLHWGTTVRGLAAGGVVTDRGVERARWIVGADGSRSRMARWAGLALGSPRRRFGVRRHVRRAPWSDRVEVHWGDGCEAYVTPVSDDEVGVALLSSRPRLRFEQLSSLFPRLAERLGNAPTSSGERGSALPSLRVRSPVRGKLFLVGDAAGSLDAIGGQGLSVGFGQARLLARAIAAEDPGLYRCAHRRCLRWPALANRGLLAMAARPALRRVVLGFFAAHPPALSRLLELHGPPEQFPDSPVSAGASEPREGVA